MTTKRKSVDTGMDVEVKTTKNFNNWKGFVNIELTDEMKTEAMAVAGNPIDLFRGVETICNNSFKLSLSFSPTQDVFIATATGNADSGNNEGIAVSARSSNVERAIAALYVKLDVAAAWDLFRLFTGGVVRQIDI
jgi:hypothetical protein